MTSKLTQNQIIDWLFQGDLAIQYQTYRDLLDQNRKDLQDRIATEGWGARYLSLQKKDGHWGQGFYQPKWISTHYTLLDLRNLEIKREIPSIQNIINVLLEENKGTDGGMNPHRELAQSDVCVNGMFLHYACYFKAAENQLRSIVDFILDQHMPDGGFNCRLNRSGAKHSSLHSTISLLEGIESYQQFGYTYRLDELLSAKQSSIDFILLHQLYISDRIGEIIKKEFLRLPYPSRWKYDILRALDYFQWAAINYDERMQPALEMLKKKQRNDGRWNVQAKHPGKLHFEMEKAGKPSRWNTLRALRVLKKYFY